MLVLSRGKNQGIRFPGLGVSVEILEVAGNKVKVGVDAPMEVRILRDELLQEDEVRGEDEFRIKLPQSCLLYTSPSPRDQRGSRMPSSA